MKSDGARTICQGRLSMQTKHAKNQKINAFLIGTGGQGARRGYSIKLSNGWNLAGVYDTDSNRARSMAKKWKCKSYSEVLSGIRDKDIDMVVIATPPSYHDELIEMAIDTGKHVLCEKPLTIHSESAQKLAEKAEAKGVILATGFNHRFYKPVLDAAELIKNQVFGELIQIDGRIGQKPDEQDLNGWLGNNRISGGGVLTDNGSHLIDLIQLFIGQVNQPQDVQMKWDKTRSHIEIFASANLSGSNGCKAFVECSWMDSDEPYLAMELVCDRGRIRISAFPWRLEIVPTDGQRTVRNYLIERILMKLYGFKSPGLEPSLMREMESIRERIFGDEIKLNNVNFATGFDGANVSKTISSILNASIGMK
jgi:predicted dehydrogenase